MRYLIQIARYTWPAPYTLMGIAIGLLLFGRFRRVNGIVEIHSPQIAAILNRLYVPALAMTFGHVVFGQSQAALDATRDHELVHVRQYERWGIVFVPAYLVASAYLLVKGRDAYRENPFEIEAYSIDHHDSE